MENQKFPIVIMVSGPHAGARAIRRIRGQAGENQKARSRGSAHQRFSFGGMMRDLQGREAVYGESVYGRSPAPASEICSTSMERQRRPLSPAKRRELVTLWEQAMHDCAEDADPSTG